MAIPFFGVTPQLNDVISKGDTGPVPFNVCTWRKHQTERAAEFQRLICEMYHPAQTILPVTFR